MIGLPADQIKMVFSLVIGFPFGFLFRSITSSKMRHTVAILAGLFLQYLIYRNEILHVFATSLITYFILSSFSKRRYQGALAVCAFNMLYLSCYHLYSMITNYGGWSVDISIVLMMNVAKFTSLAWCYKDGAEPREKLSEDQWKRRVETLPDLTEYFSYVFFYATALVGPCFDFREYSDFIALRGDFENIPSSFVPGITTMLSGFAFMVVFVLFGPLANVKTYHEQWYADLPFYRKVLYSDAGSFLIRTKYYTGWMLATSSCIMSGFSYNGKDDKGRDRWNRVVSVRPLDYECNDNVRDKLEAWNASIQTWLRRYVFFRICREDEVRLKPKKAALASNLTFMVSAFWHGFYPSFYLCFFQLFLVQNVSKSIFTWKHAFKWIPEPLAFPLRWVLTNMFTDYISCAFTILEVDKIYPFWSGMHFYVSIILSSLFFYFMFLGSPRKKTMPAPTGTTAGATPTSSPEKVKAN
jgi:lysophospholipid acyltransferase